jgi:hypothetical protein
LEDTAQLEDQYERLINRCMLHHCCEGYCLSRQRRDKDGNMTCRFNFPIEIHGFEAIFDDLGQKLIGMEKELGGLGKGADFVKGKLKFWRNHPTVVHHMPEYLLIWEANIKGRPVQSYQQVLRYLLKYMMKDEPNSAPFSAVCKGVVEASKDEDPVRRAFQKILMKTVGKHNLSKQECHHIVNGLEFVQFSCDFVGVNIMGTRRVRTPQTEEVDNQPAAEANLAFVYWGLETDPAYHSMLRG